MTRPIKRGIPFPLPFDINSHMELVEKYAALWIKISRERLLKDGYPEVVNQLVNCFFDVLPVEQQDWLEGYELRWKKPRAVLIRERALQLAQREEGKEILERYADWLEKEFEGILGRGKETKR